jgi:transposase
MAALAVGRSATALGAFHRRLAARIGKPQALTADGPEARDPEHRVLKGELAYRDPGPETYDAQQRTRLLRWLCQHASTLGCVLVNRDTGEIIPAAT